MARLSLIVFLSLLTFLLVSPTTAERKTVGYYTLKKGDFSVRVTNWGATILNVFLPDAKGNIADVVLGYDHIGGYVNETTYFGALVGRVANRIGGARFVLDGKAYRLFPNDNKNTLHGGHRGFNQQFWTVKEKVDGEFPYIKLYYHSFDGEQGLPSVHKATQLFNGPKHTANVEQLRKGHFRLYESPSVIYYKSTRTSNQIPCTVEKSGIAITSFIHLKELVYNVLLQAKM